MPIEPVMKLVRDDAGGIRSRYTVPLDRWNADEAALRADGWLPPAEVRAEPEPKPAPKRRGTPKAGVDDGAAADRQAEA